MAMFCNEKSPLLHQPVLTSRVKGAESRHLLSIVAGFFPKLARKEVEVEMRMCALLQNTASYYKCIESKSNVLDEATQKRCEIALLNMNKNYSALQAWAIATKKRTWHCTIKFHFAMHLALLSRSMNPRFAWTYGDEDFMGLVKKVGEACTAGTAPQKMVAKLCAKYAAGMDLSCNQ